MASGIGSDGIVEVFLPPGGAAGQVLQKIDTQNYNATWGAGGGGGGSGVGGIAAGTQSATATNSTVVFSNSNNVSFGMSNSSVVTASASFNQTNQTGGIYITAQSTGQSSSSTYDLRTLSVVGDGVVSAGWSNGTLRISATQSNQAASASNGSFTFQTLNFSNANNVTFGTSAGGVVSASVAAQTNQTAGIYGSSQTFGQSSSSTYDARSLSVVGSGGVSVGWSNSSLLISGQTTAAQTTQSAIKAFGASNTGNTAGNTGVSTGIDWVLAGSNNITISESTAAGGPNTLWVSGPSVGGAQTGISGIVVSNTTYTSGTVSFSNANGISFGSSAGQAITASYTVPTQTNQTGGIYVTAQSTGQSSSSTYDLRTFSLVPDGIISAGWSNGSFRISATQSVQTQASGNIVGSGVTTAGNNIGLSGTLNSAGLSLSATVAAQTNQTGGIYVTAQSTGQSSSSTYDLRTLSVVGDGIISAGWSNGTFRISGTQSNQAFSAAGGSSAFQTLGFSDNAAASFTNTNGSLAIASVRASLFATSNTTQSSSGTANLNSLIFAGAGIASVGVTNGSVVVSVPSGGGAGDGGVFAGVSTAGNTAGSTGTVSTGNFVLVGTGALTLSQSTAAAGSAATVTLSVPQTSSLVGTNGISLSTNGSTISISAVQYTGSYWQPEIYGNTMTTTFANNTVYFRPFELAQYVDVDKLIMQMSGSSSASTASFSASVSGAVASSGTGTWGHSGTVGIFSRVNTNDTHADYTKIITFDTHTYSFGAGYSASVSASTNASSATVSVTTSGAVSWIQGINDTGGITTSSSGTSSSTSFSSTSTNANSFSSSFILSFPYAHLSGFRPIFAPMSGSAMSPGEYWLGLQNSTASGSTNMSLQRVAMMGSVHYLVFTATTNNYAEIGNSVAITSSNYRLGFGSHSGSNQTTTTMALSAISTNASNMSMWFALDGHSH